MLQIKKLPEWSETEESLTESGTKKTKVAKKERKKDIFFGFFIVSLCLSVIFGVWLVWTLCSPPRLIDVFYKKTMFSFGDDKNIAQDSTPTTPEDFMFFFYTNQYTNVPYQTPNKQLSLVKDAVIDFMPPQDAVRYFDVLKNGPALSDNFYDNYSYRKNSYYIKTGILVLLFLICLTATVLTRVLPQRQTVVGTMRGSEWKK